MGEQAGTIEAMKRESAVPVVVADQQGLITFVNERFPETFGWTRDEIIGKPLATIIPPALRDAHHMGFSRFLTTGAATLLDRPLMLKAVGKDGSEFEAEHVIRAERRDGHWVFAAAIRRL